MKLFLHYSAYQLVWYGIILGLYYKLSWLLWLPSLLFLAAHFTKFSQAKKRDLAILITGTLFGSLIDTLFMNLNFVSYQNHNLPIIPYWLILLWCSFTLTLPYALKFLQTRPWAASLLGSTGFLLAYSLPDRLDLLSVSNTGKIAIFVTWLVLFPILVWTIKTIGGMFLDKYQEPG